MNELRYLQSSNDSSSSNQTNSTSTPDSSVKPSTNTSLLSAWQLWIGILLGILLIFGLTVLLWYLAKINKRKILCFGPSSSSNEEEQAIEVQEATSKNNDFSRIQEQSRSTQSTLNTMYDRKVERETAGKVILKQEQPANRGNLNNRNSDQPTRGGISLQSRGQAALIEAINKKKDPAHKLNNNNKVQDFDEQNDEEGDEPGDNEDQDGEQENGEEQNNGEVDQLDEVREQDFSEKLKEILGPQKTDEYWANVKEALQDAALDKYKMTNHLNQAPSITAVRSFDPYRPIIPPLSNYIMKPSTTYLTAYRSSSQLSFTTINHPLYQPEQLSSYELQQNSSNSLQQNSLSPYLSRDASYGGQHSNNFISWLESHKQKVKQQTKSTEIITKYIEPRPLQMLRYQA